MDHCVQVLAPDSDTCCPGKGHSVKWNALSNDPIQGMFMSHPAEPRADLSINMPHLGCWLTESKMVEREGETNHGKLISMAFSCQISAHIHFTCSGMDLQWPSFILISPKRPLHLGFVCIVVGLICLPGRQKH